MKKIIMLGGTWGGKKALSKRIHDLGWEDSKLQRWFPKLISNFKHNLNKNSKEFWFGGGGFVFAKSCLPCLWLNTWKVEDVIVFNQVGKNLKEWHKCGETVIICRDCLFAQPQSRRPLCSTEFGNQKITEVRKKSASDDYCSVSRYVWTCEVCTVPDPMIPPLEIYSK